MTESAVWVVRGGNYNELASQVKVKRAVAIGWSSGGDFSSFQTALSDCLIFGGFPHVHKGHNAQIAHRRLLRGALGVTPWDRRPPVEQCSLVPRDSRVLVSGAERTSVSVSTVHHALSDGEPSPHRGRQGFNADAQF